MNDDIYTMLLQQMDAMVVEALPTGDFRLLAPPPPWVLQFMPGAGETGETVSLDGRFPFLDNFLIDARIFWQAGAGTGKKKSVQNRLFSEAWIETDRHGREYPLEAYAMHLGDYQVLSIQYLGYSYYQQVSTLQTARENLLDKEILEREVRKRTAQVRAREEQIAMRLLAAAGFRDEETGAHVRRLGLYSQEMAIALRWDRQQVDDIRIAAPMHDIGKIGIPDGILLKPGKLSADEYRIMQRHPVIGAQMLGGTDIPLLNMASEIAHYHHEKWDGSGYPAGLKGEQIPLVARIVALADVFDALSHKRVYKTALPEKEVLDHLQRESGKHFDPALVDLFMSILPAIRRIRDETPDGDEPWAVAVD